MNVKKAKNKSTILFVDQAVSFGGSIVVLGSLVGAIDKQKFRLVKKVIVVGEDYDNFIKDKPETIEVYPTKAKDVAVLQYTSGTTKKFPDAIPH